MNMQPMTGKELEYIADSMSNEDLLTKQCAVTVNQTQNQSIRQLANSMLQTHQQHYHTLLNCINQHVQAAPQQPQQ